MKNNINRSAMQLQAIFNTTSVGFGILVNRVFKEVNDACCQMLAYSREELIGRDSRILYPTDEEYQTFEQVYQKIRQPGSTTTEIRLLRKDGEIINVVMNISALDKNDLARGVILSLVNITERKKAEEALYTSEENFRNSIENSPFGIRIISEEGETLYANRAILDIYGYKSMEELKTTPVKKRYTPENYAEFQVRREKRRRGEILPNSYMISIMRKDGEVRQLQVIRTEVLWAGKREYQTLYQDITERKKAEEALRESEEKYRLIVDNSQDLIFIEDVAGKVLYMSPSIKNMLGYNQADIIGGSFRALIHPDDQVGLEEAIKRNIKYGYQNTGGVEFRIRNTAGDWRWYIGRGNAVRDANGKFINFIGIANDITARKQAEKALAASEQNFRNSLDSSLMGIRIVDAEWHTLYVNQVFLNLFGYKNIDEVIRTSLQDRYTPEEHARYLQRMEKRGESIPDNPKVDIVGKNGNVLTIVVYASEVLWDGKPARQLIYQDITERQKAEEALKLSEQNFRNSLDGSSMGIRIMGDADSTLYANQALLDMFGYKDIDELSASPPQEHYTPESYAGFIQRREKFLRGEPLPDQLEFDVIRKDGAIRHLQLFSKNVLWDGKQQYQFLYNDITQRVQAEEVLKKSEENLHNLLESLPIGVRITDTDENTLYINRAFINILGYENIDEVKKMPPVKYYTAESYANYLLRREKLLRGEPRPDKVEVDIIRKDGTIRNLQLSTVELLWNGKRQYETIYIDITERKQAEEEKHRLEEKAQVNSRLAAVGEMAAGIAHEINNPLTGVLGFSQMLLENENVPEDIKEDLKIIANGSRRAADIIKRLLTFARQTKPLKTSVNLNELIDNTLRLREYVLKTNNINVITRFDPKLPWVVVDPGQMQQVFINLIVNAEQAIKKAHGKGILTVSTEKIGNNIRISFQDDGIGITKENRAHLFEPFFTTKDVGEGSGLGLSLSRSIVLEHSGKIDVESEPGCGAIFIIELPITKALPSETAASIPINKDKSAETKKGRILVVDDEPEIRDLLDKVMTQMGYAVDTTADAKTAMDKLVAGVSYDVILTDVRMPGISGIEMYTSIVEKTPMMKNRIIFITGDVMGTDIKDFLTQNKLTYLDKPFDIKTLKENINSIMRAVLP